MDRNVNERPILFNAEMVRAILDGRKTQTRRIIKSDPEKIDIRGKWVIRFDGLNWNEWMPTAYSSYGTPGNRLWVRETWATHPRDNAIKPSELPLDATIYYRASYPNGTPDGTSDFVWRPSIFMTRNASRIALEITGVRAERLQQISEDDAESEGIELIEHNCYRNYQPTKPDTIHFVEDPIGSFRSLWDSINAKRGYSWDYNPWVWVIDFKVQDVSY